MTNLVLTAGRMALLRDVDHGEVWFDGRAVVNTLTGLNVLSESTKLRDAGLVDVDFAAERLGSYPYVLTDAGRTALAKEGGTNGA